MKIWKGLLWIGILILLVFNGCANKETSHKTRLWLVSQVDTFEKFVPEFQETHPDLKIKWDPLYTGDYYTKLQTEMAGNSAPDVIYFTQKSLADFGTRGALADLRPFIERDKLDLNIFYPQAFKEGEVSSGAVYGLPLTGGPEVLYYNRDVFDKSGIKYPDETWTWDTFLDAGKRVTQDTDGDGRVDQFAIDARFVEYWAAALPCIWMNGGDLFNEEKTRCIVNSPESQEAIQFLVDFFKKYRISPVGDVVQTMHGVGFLSGKVAMNIYLPWSVVSQYSKIKHFKWAIALVPRGKAGRIPRYTGECFSIWSGSKHKEEAWELVKFLTSEEVAKKIAEEGWMSSRKAVVNSSSFIKEDTPWDEKVFVDSMNYARALPSIPYLGGQEGKLNSIWTIEMQLAMLGNKSVPEALRDIENKTNEELKVVMGKKD